MSNAMDSQCDAALAQALGHAAPFSKDELAGISSLTVLHAKHALRKAEDRSEDASSFLDVEREQGRRRDLVEALAPRPSATRSRTMEAEWDG
jgi:hypothetical protein